MCCAACGLARPSPQYEAQSQEQELYSHEGYEADGLQDHYGGQEHYGGGHEEDHVDYYVSYLGLVVGWKDYYVK